MTAKEVMKILDISIVTLHKYVDEGKIKIRERISKTKFDYDEESVLALAKNMNISEDTIVKSVSPKYHITIKNGNQVMTINCTPNIMKRLLNSLADIISTNTEI